MSGVFRPAPAGSWIGLPARVPATADPPTARQAPVLAVGAGAAVLMLVLGAWSLPRVAGAILGIAVVLALVAAARRAIETHHRGIADAAVLQERRRIARDLHDGVAQDLAFIASRVGTLDREHAGDVALDQLRSAAQRALDESRAAIAALTRPPDEPLAAALERNATEVADRLGGRAELAADDGIAVPAATREALVRIVREATANAVRHGVAGTVAVSLTGGDALRLTIADDGCGFDAAARDARRATGFGLVSMTERAEALGGRLAVASAPGAGATIEVVVPWTGR